MDQGSGKYRDAFKTMAKNYEKMELDCLVTIGGNGTHAAAGILADHGLNVIGMPKTIDNDIWGTASDVRLPERGGISRRM